MRTRVRGLLGAFLFSGEDVEKKVQVLSGGEKSRLVLAKMLLMPVQRPIFDEPTNHLDMQAKNIFKQPIQNYTGSVIIVSHDRDFLTGLTDKVYEFRNRQLKLHFGDIQAFLEARKIDSLNELGVQSLRRSGNQATTAAPV